MTGLVSIGEQLRIMDPVSGDNGTVGVVDRVELTGVRLVLPDGRKVRRSWGLERVPTSAWRPFSEAPRGKWLVGFGCPKNSSMRLGLFFVTGHTLMGETKLHHNSDFWPQYPPTHWYLIEPTPRVNYL